MSLSEHYLRLMNLANQAHDRETYQYFVDQAKSCSMRHRPIHPISPYRFSLEAPISISRKWQDVSNQ